MEALKGFTKEEKKREEKTPLVIPLSSAKVITGCHPVAFEGDTKPIKKLMNFMSFS